MTDHAAPDTSRSYQWTSHRNALGDWCAWSYVAVSAHRATSEDAHCPAGCPASDIEAVPDDNQG